MLTFHEWALWSPRSEHGSRYQKLGWNGEKAAGVLVNERPVARQKRQKILIYMLFLAEAIMASSLQPQLKMLIAQDSFCGSLSSSYVKSVLDCAYAAGGAAGLFWGWLSDRVGRRPVVLMGIFGMALCCLGMGFATDLLSCAILNVLAGLITSCVAVTTLTMIGDISESTSEKAKRIVMLPLIASCGSLGPIVLDMLNRSLAVHDAIWELYPNLSSQITCGSLVLLIAVAASLTLEETLPEPAGSLQHADLAFSNDCEKEAILMRVQPLDNLSEDHSVTIVDLARQEPISLGQIIRAPSLLLLLASFSLLSLQSSTFDALLPHLGQSPSHRGRFGLPCDVLPFSLLLVGVAVGTAIATALPGTISHFGLLRPYRLLSLTFPAVYLIIPSVGHLISSSATATLLSSSFCILLKNLLFSSAQVLVAILVLAASPDARSTGSIVGLMQSAHVFKAVAAAISGLAFYLGTAADVSVVITNFAFLAGLMGLSLAGACMAWFVRDHPTVNRDFPAELLNWETCFDAGAQDGMGLV